MDSDSDTVKWVKVDKESDIKKGLKDEKILWGSYF